MRNIILFIRRHFTLISFVFLQAVSWYFLVKYNRFHRGVFLGKANAVTGAINTQYEKVNGFFGMKAENRRINKMNDSLLNLLPQNFIFPDTSVRIVSDTIIYDTTRGYRRYRYRDATVIYSTTNFENNFLQIDRGASTGIKDEMAVVAADGSFVGVVVNENQRFSNVLTILNKKQKISASLKNESIERAAVSWEGGSSKYLVLQNVPKSVKVKVGDTVLTSNSSLIIPPGLIIGTIAEVANESATTLYKLKVKIAADLNNLHQVHVIENLNLKEQQQLLSESQKQLDKN